MDRLLQASEVVQILPAGPRIRTDRLWRRLCSRSVKVIDQSAASQTSNETYWPPLLLSAGRVCASRLAEELWNGEKE